MFKFTDNTITTEITKGVYLNLKAEYKWNSNTELDLKLSWEPHSSEGPYSASSLTTSFSSPLGELNINGTRIGNQTLENTYNTTLTDINSNAQNITITFKYVNGNALVDLTQDFNKLVIPKPNKYDNNVVFNRDGLNEMIDYFLKYPVRSIEESENYGHITIAHGKDEAENICIKGLENKVDNEGNSVGLTITTNLLPNVTETYDLGDENLQWKNLYLSSDANVNGVVKANELEGLLTGGGININDRFKVDDEGNVTMQGNITWGDSQFITVYHEGEFTSIEGWKEVFRYSDALTFYDYDETTDTYAPVEIPGDSPAAKERNFTQLLNHYDGLYIKTTKHTRTIPIKPSNGSSPSSFPNSATTESKWHTILDPEKDWYMSMTFNGGKEWTDPFRINAQDGSDGQWDARSILDALRDIDADGIYNLPSIQDGQVQGRLGIKASAIQSLLAEFGVINMGVLTNNGDEFDHSNYWASDNTQLMGGYITFPIPAPFRLTALSNVATEAQVNAINDRGWRARLGYLRGNGDGNNPTSGVGFAIYTTATFKDIYGIEEIYADGTTWENTTPGSVPKTTAKNVAKKCHLLLAFLMLTDSGLGLLTSTNKTRPVNWVFKDNLSASEDFSNPDDIVGKDGNGNIPHYYYRWWTGSNESDIKQNNKYRRINRLWLHEDNGGLYWSGKTTDGLTLKPWNWADGQITG